MTPEALATQEYNLLAADLSAEVPQHSIESAAGQAVIWYFERKFKTYVIDHAEVLQLVPEDLSTPDRPLRDPRELPMRGDLLQWPGEGEPVLIDCVTDLGTVYWSPARAISGRSPGIGKVYWRDFARPAKVLYRAKTE